MAIKRNAQKILLTVFTSQQQSPLVVSSDKLRLVVPDLTETGYRSLLLFLINKDLLFREKVFGAVSVGITDQGRKALISLFPALDDRWQVWNGQWMVLVFLEATKTDPHFRYLRSLLLQEQALVLSRGVYLAAGSFSHRIMQECESLYSSAVAVFSVDTWYRGLNRPLIVNYYDLTAKVEVYSGISGDVSQLLGKVMQNKNSTDQQKTNISSIIDRLIDSLREDPGFIKYFFPDVPGVTRILSDLQKIINI